MPQNNTNTFTIENHITLQQIKPDYPIIHLSNSHGTATIALHGAHLTSYTPTHQKPVIFTSKKAIYKEGTAIRGGIPLCWPWFNAHPSDPTLPSHGHARKKFWKITKTNHTPQATSIQLTLTHDQLKAEATITLGSTLQVTLTTTNLSNTSQTIGGALHSYLNISHIKKIHLTGLEKSTFIDTLTNTQEQQTGPIHITEETDRIYTNNTNTTIIHDPQWNRTIRISKTGSKSTVIWNPWIEKSKNITDLDNNEYINFICVEAANAGTDTHQLTPLASHTLSTEISSETNPT